MTYAFQVLPGAAGSRQKIAAAIDRDGVWEGFVEVRMGAGPTVRIARLDDVSDGYEVAVTWGAAQSAHTLVHGADSAIEAADRLALALYDIRGSSRVLDER